MFKPPGAGFATLHAKTWCCDGEVYLGGSVNFTYNSIENSFENLVIAKAERVFGRSRKKLSSCVPPCIECGGGLLLAARVCACTCNVACVLVCIAPGTQNSCAAALTCVQGSQSQVPDSTALCSVCVCVAAQVTLRSLSRKPVPETALLSEPAEPVAKAKKEEEYATATSTSC